MKDKTPPKPQKRLEKPWVIAAFGAPVRLLTKGAQVPGAVSALVMFLFLVVVVYYILPRPKSFHLDVVTDFLEVETDADTLIVWEIEEAVLCMPDRLVPEDHPARLTQTDTRACFGRFVEARIEDVQLDWPEGVKLRVRSGIDGELDILIQFEESEFVRIGPVDVVTETVMRIPREVLDWNGGLGLSGRVTLGQTAEHGTVKLLRSGRYETHEKPFLRRNAQLVSSGEFSIGDVVAIEPGGEGLASSAYVFVTLSDTSRAAVTPMQVIATSPRGNNRLRLDRARTNSVYLEPTWSQRIANDPLAIGIATLLSLLATFLGVLNNLFRR